ncbi:MAG: hypothetical protein ACLFRG_18655 [Desulfococcaceae bacterium]
MAEEKNAARAPAAAPNPFSSILELSSKKGGEFIAFLKGKINRDFLGGSKREWVSNEEVGRNEF